MALRETDAGYRELFEENPQPMWVCHRETQKLLAGNQAALTLYGYGRAEFLELSLPLLMGGGFTADPASTRDQFLACRQLRKDGTALQVELIWHPCRFNDDAVQLVLAREAADQAVLQHRVAEQGSRLEAAHRELEAFSYSVSHDLRAPLRHIDGFSRALMDDYAAVLDAQAQEYLTRICQAAAKMSQLIDAMQQLSRVGRTELSRERIDLSVKAQVVSLELSHREPERRVEFAIEEGVSAEADPKMARQLLEILIGNAWKFSSKVPSARIRFGSKEEQGRKVYFVSDNGAGFDMEYADKLFTVFHRLHRAEEFEGSGVGLAIAQRIVARHGGSIWAESAPGAGATFFFTLPPPSPPPPSP